MQGIFEQPLPVSWGTAALLEQSSVMWELGTHCQQHGMGTVLEVQSAGVLSGTMLWREGVEVLDAFLTRSKHVSVVCLMW